MAEDHLVNWRLLLAFFLFGINQVLVIFFLKMSGQTVTCGLGEKLAIRSEVRDMDTFSTSGVTHSNLLDDKMDTLKRADGNWNRQQDDLHEKTVVRNKRETLYDPDVRTQTKHLPGNHMAGIAERTGVNHGKIGIFRDKEKRVKRAVEKIISKI